MDTEMEVHPFNSLICQLVFPYLKLKDLLSASLVCKTWKAMTMDKLLWKTIEMENIMVVDWEKFIDTINEKGTVNLNVKQMLIPELLDEYECFWINFNEAIIKAKNIKRIYLYKCPHDAVEKIINKLTKLEVFEAVSIWDQLYSSEEDDSDEDIIGDYMPLNINYLCQLTNLTELRINGLCKIVFQTPLIFADLTNLKILELTGSDSSVFNAIWDSLESVNTNLTHLEIGDCDSITIKFPMLLKRFVNLAFLRLETYVNEWNNVTMELFESIRSLKNLNCLELININFQVIVKSDLMACANLRKLLIVPSFCDFVVQIYLFRFIKKFSEIQINTILVLPTTSDIDILLSRSHRKYMRGPLTYIPVRESLQIHGNIPESICTICFI